MIRQLEISPSDNDFFQTGCSCHPEMPEKERRLYHGFQSFRGCFEGLFSKHAFKIEMDKKIICLVEDNIHFLPDGVERLRISLDSRINRREYPKYIWSNSEGEGYSINKRDDWRKELLRCYTIGVDMNVRKIGYINEVPVNLSWENFVWRYKTTFEKRTNEVVITKVEEF